MAISAPLQGQESGGHVCTCSSEKVVVGVCACAEDTALCSLLVWFALKLASPVDGLASWRAPRSMEDTA